MHIIARIEEPIAMPDTAGLVLGQNYTHLREKALQTVADPLPRLGALPCGVVSAAIEKTGLKLAPETTHQPLYANIVSWSPEKHAK